MRERGAIDAAADHDLESLGGAGHRHGLLENGDHPVLAAGVLGVVVVHVRLGVADQRRIVVELLFRHRVELRLRQAIPVLDGVAAGGDRVLQPFAAEVVAAGLVAEAMRLVNQRLQDRQRIGRHVLRLARGREGVPSGRDSLIQSAPRPICSRTAARASSTERTTAAASGFTGALDGVAPHTMPRVDT